MPRSTGPKMTRFTMWVPDEIMKELSRQQLATGKGSLAEVVREAVEVYRSLLQAKAQGVNLYFEDGATGEKGRIWLLPGPPPVSKPKR